MSDDLPTGSQDALKTATESSLSFSGHGDALGAAGKRVLNYDPDNSELLSHHGQNIAISPGPEGFEEILIGVEWNVISKARGGLLGKLLKPKTKPVDLDIGCLYELEDGSRGVIQAFGKDFGAYNKPPFIFLTGDERSGEADGHDEVIHINGEHWSAIKRILVYLYIYDGAKSWKEVNPRLIIDVPGNEDLVVTLEDSDATLPICAIGGLEQIRGGIKLTNYTEYFPGHAEMDRAFGYGIQWTDGKKV